MSSGPVWCRPGPAVAARAPTALFGASSQTWRRPDVGGVDAGKAGTYSTVLQSRTKLRKHCVLVCVWIESRKTTGKTHRNNQQILKTTSKRKSCVLADNPAAITMSLWCILLQAEEKRELPSPPRQTKFLALAAPQASEQAGRVQQACGPRAASDAPTACSDHSHATDLSAAKGLCAWGRPAARQRVCDRSACCRLATRRPSRSSLSARFSRESQLTASVYSQASLHHHC